MVFPLLPSAISLPDWERSATNYTAKTNLSVKVLDFVQLGGARLPGPILAEDTLRDILDDMPSVPG